MDLADIFPINPEVGYIGLILVSFFGSLIPFVPLPSFLLLATMATGNQSDLNILAVTSSIASTAAKFIIFYASYRGRKMISEETRKRMKPFLVVGVSASSLTPRHPKSKHPVSPFPRSYDPYTPPTPLGASPVRSPRAS